MATIEANKIELNLSLDVFNKPLELGGSDAWAQLILNLLFLAPGTFPSMPEMGIDITSYEFEFMDAAITKLRSAIKQQVDVYLPDIPLTDVEVYELAYEGKNFLVIHLTFNDNGRSTARTLISAESTRFLDFEISW